MILTISALVLCWLQHVNSATQTFSTACQSKAEVLDTTLNSKKLNMRAIFNEEKKFYMVGTQQGSGGTYGFTNLCASGTYDPAKKEFKSTAGSIATKKLDFKGTYEMSKVAISPTERRFEGKVVVPTDGLTAGADQAYEAMCGFYTETNTYQNFVLKETSRKFTGTGYIADATNKMVAKYNYDATVKGSCGVGTIYGQTSGDATTDGKKIKEVAGLTGRFLVITIDETKTPATLFFKGYLGPYTFKGQGTMENGYYAITQWKLYPDKALVSATFSPPQATCASDGGPISKEVTFEADEINSKIYNQAAVQRWKFKLTTSKTWTADAMRDTPFGRPKFAGTLDTNPADGKEAKSAIASNKDATTLGLTYQLVGKYGYGAMVISKSQFTCPTDPATLPLPLTRISNKNYFTGCGTIDPTTQKFTGSGMYKGKKWTATDVVIVHPATGNLRFVGSLTWDSKKISAYSEGSFTPSYYMAQTMIISNVNDGVVGMRAPTVGMMMGNALVFSGYL